MTASANFDPLAYLGGVSAHLGGRARADFVTNILLNDGRARPRASNLALWWAARIAAILGDRDRAVALYRQRFVQHGAPVGVHVDNRDLDSLLDIHRSSRSWPKCGMADQRAGYNSRKNLHQA